MPVTFLDQVLSSLQNVGLVRHASGHPDHPVLYGSFIYFLRLTDKEAESPYRGDFEAFQVRQKSQFQTPAPGLRIRIDLMRIRIQHFF
jgi:hypothetical protein